MYASPDELKIVFTGTRGAGKTTAIRALADRAGVSTEGPPGDGATPARALVTVGLDYGECLLQGGVALRLFGTPGHERFRFMWDILGTGAFGLVVLADNARPDPVQDALGFLRSFAPHVPQRRTVVGVGRLEGHPAPSVAQWCERLAAEGFHVPVVEVDVRRPEDARLLVSVLVSMAEVDQD